MSWMNFSDYVLIEHAVNDRLDDLRRTAQRPSWAFARPSGRTGVEISGWPEAGVRRFSHALVGALAALGILAVAATALA